MTTGRSRLRRTARLLLLALLCQFGAAYGGAGPAHHAVSPPGAGEAAVHAAAHEHAGHHAHGAERPHCADGLGGDAACGESVHACPFCASLCGFVIPATTPASAGGPSTSVLVAVAGRGAPLLAASLYRPPIAS